MPRNFKLNKEQIEEIKSKLEMGITQKRLSKDYEVTEKTIFNILKREGLK